MLVDASRPVAEEQRQQQDRGEAVEELEEMTAGVARQQEQDAGMTEGGPPAGQDSRATPVSLLLPALSTSLIPT